MFRNCLLFALCAIAALAQIDRASVTGTAFDPSGASIPEVAIEVRNLDTGFVSRMTSGAAGSFTIVGLPLGRYTMSASKEGFREWKIAEFRLSVGEIRKIDVTLGLLTQAATVEVVDAQPVIDQTSFRQGIVVGGAELRNIPVNGRDWSAYMLLAPGAVDSGGGSQRSIRVMGRSKDDNNFVFDGIDATGVKEGPHLVALRTVISNDAISEFKVTTGMYTAETGFGIGAQVSLVSKSGTNSFHGGLFEYLRNDAFDARRFIDLGGLPKFRMNQFGGNVGGPVAKDRTHFFANYEGLRQVLGRTFNGFVPSRSFRSQVLATSPSLQPVIDYYPLGDQATSNPEIDFLSQYIANENWKENSGMFRVDHRFSDRFTGYVRYNVADGVISNPQGIFRNVNNALLTTHNAVVQAQNILTPTLINEVKLGFNRSNQSSARTGFRDSVNVPGFTSIPNLQSGANPGNSYSLIDNLFWTKGRHSVKAGFEIRAMQVNISQSDSRGLSYASRANFIANRADSIGVVGEFGSRGVRSEAYMGYIQDDIKLKPNLTINLGVRYEYYVPIYEVNGRVRIFAEKCGGICPNPGTDLYGADRNNIGPRVGFAWTPKLFGSKTTIRGGFGVYHMLGQIDDILGPLESDNVRLSLTARENPLLSYPLEPFLAPGSFLADTPRALATERKDFEAYQAGLFIVQELPKQFALQVGYATNQGRHLLERNWSNFINPATGTRPLPAFGQVDNKFSGNRSNHHGMQVSLNRRFVNGWLWGTQYMWSKTIDQNGPGSNEGSTPQNPACRACDRAASATDVRHNITLSNTYELPFGKGKRMLNSGLASHLFGGWDLSGIATGRTGFPVNVSVARPAADVPTGNSQQQRPNLVPGVNVYPTNRTPQNWINIAAFAVPARGTFGNLGRNVLRGPRLFQMDIALARRIAVTERFGFQIRAEAFNLTNRPQYGNPQANISAPGTFGVITGIVNGGATGSGRSRSLQFMLRLDF
jgi:hypothetical protein